MKKNHLSLAVAFVGITLASVSVSSAFAADTTVTVCQNKKTGATRFLPFIKNKPATCNSKTENTLTLNSLGQQGAKGDTGAKGEAGVAGVKGDAGEQGIQGIAGVAGAKGDAGEQGIQGIAGVAGAKGDAGEQGIQGIAGVAGAKGDTGEQGIQGIAGVAGPQGEAGVAGPQGPQGEAGVAGPQGETGVAGPQGEAGIAGPQGPAGPAGTNGTGINVYDANGFLLGNKIGYLTVYVPALGATAQFYGESSSGKFGEVTIFDYPRMYYTSAGTGPGQNKVCQGTPVFEATAALLEPRIMQDGGVVKLVKPTAVVVQNTTFLSYSDNGGRSCNNESILLHGTITDFLLTAVAFPKTAVLPLRFVP